MPESDPLNAEESPHADDPKPYESSFFDGCCVLGAIALIASCIIGLVRGVPFGAYVFSLVLFLIGITVRRIPKSVYLSLERSRKRDELGEGIMEDSFPKLAQQMKESTEKQLKEFWKTPVILGIVIVFFSMFWLLAVSTMELP